MRPVKYLIRSFREFNTVTSLKLSTGIWSLKISWLTSTRRLESLILGSRIHTRVMRGSKLHAVRLVMRRPKWLMVKSPTSRLWLISGRLESSYMPWFAASCPLKILILESFTRRFWVENTQCRVIYQTIWKTSWKKCSLSTLRSESDRHKWNNTLGGESTGSTTILKDWWLAITRSPWTMGY